MSGVRAQGADELLIALQTPTPRGHWGIPILLWGPPGVGKTSFVESLQREDFPVLTLIASIHDPTDFSGLPLHIDGRTHFAPPEWSYQFDEESGGILFLDELTTAPPSVQAALLRVVLERRVGTRDIPGGVRIVAAANPPSNVVGGWELSPPLANRFVHVQWDLASADFVQALEVGFDKPEQPVIDPTLHAAQVPFWRLLIRSFLRRNSELVYTEATEGEYAFATPRTWEYAVSLMASCDLLGHAVQVGQPDTDADSANIAPFLALVRGCVGAGATTNLLGYLKDLAVPDPEKVLDGEPFTVGALQDDELYVLFSAMAACLTRRVGQEAFLDSLLVLLTHVRRVNKAERVDTIFAPVREIVLGNLIQQAVAAAHKADRQTELQTRLQRVFHGTPLAEYLQLLGN